MIRFSMNRWLGFLLTLCLFTASFLLLGVSAPTVALADTYSLLLPSDPGNPGGPAVRDPDVPMGPGDGKSTFSCRPLGRVEVDRGVTKLGARPAGDVTASGSVVVDRVRLVLLSLRSLYLGF